MPSDYIPIHVEAYLESLGVSASGADIAKLLKLYPANTERGKSLRSALKELKKLKQRRRQGKATSWHVQGQSDVYNKPTQLPAVFKDAAKTVNNALSSAPTAGGGGAGGSAGGSAASAGGSAGAASAGGAAGVLSPNTKKKQKQRQNKKSKAAAAAGAASAGGSGSAAASAGGSAGSAGAASAGGSGSAAASAAGAASLPVSANTRSKKPPVPPKSNSPAKQTTPAPPQTPAPQSSPSSISPQSKAYTTPLNPVTASTLAGQSMTGPPQKTPTKGGPAVPQTPAAAVPNPNPSSTITPQTLFPGTPAPGSTTTTPAPGSTASSLAQVKAAAQGMKSAGTKHAASSSSSGSGGGGGSPDPLAAPKASSSSGVGAPTPGASPGAGGGASSRSPPTNTGDNVAPGTQIGPYAPRGNEKLGGPVFSEMAQKASQPGAQSDQFAVGFEAKNTVVDSLRSEYGMEDPKNVVAPVVTQKESDIEFDMFSVVRPGFGEGVHNKLFVMDQNRDAKIVYREPMTSPGAYIGPINGITVPPWQLQTVMPASKVHQHNREVIGKRKLEQYTYDSMGVDTTGVLGYDHGFSSNVSSAGLKRNRQSPFEPVIMNDGHWEQVKPPIGVDLNRYEFRRATEAYRRPLDLHTYQQGMGGPLMSKRRALEVILN